MSYEPSGWRSMDFEDKVGWSLLLGVIGSLALLLGVLLVMSLRADGRSDFCYVAANSTATGKVWGVESHRPWRADMTLGFFATPEEAKRAMELFGCKAHTERP